MNLTSMVTRPALKSGVRLFSTTAKAKELVANHIATNKVAIFSKTYCPHCARAKEAIGALPQAFGVLELDVHPLGAEMQSALLDMTAQKTVRRTHLIPFHPTPFHSPRTRDNAPRSPTFLSHKSTSAVATRHWQPLRAANLQNY
jgi:hypothetical protein